MEIAPEDLRIDVMRMMVATRAAFGLRTSLGTVVEVNDQPHTEENWERALLLLREQLGAA